MVQSDVLFFSQLFTFSANCSLLQPAVNLIQPADVLLILSAVRLVLASYLTGSTASTTFHLVVLAAVTLFCQLSSCSASFTWFCQLINSCSPGILPALHLVQLQL
jgi:hypothetical protein